MLNIPILVLGLDVHLLACVFAWGEPAGPLMAVPSEAKSKTLGVSMKFSPRRFPEVRICVYLFCSNLTSLLDFSDLTPKITNWEEAEPF